MNKELIRDLAMTGGIYDCLRDPYDKLGNGDYYSSIMVDLDRFTEKIVQECMDVVAKKCASPTAYQALAEHWGVEL